MTLVILISRIMVLGNL